MEQQILDKLGEIVAVIGQKYFLIGYVAGFIYGVWVTWSLNGRGKVA